MKHVYSLFLVLFISAQGYAQSVNDYKYVVVPEKFDFLTSNDQHQLNSLTKFLFNKYGFEAYLNGELMPFSINEDGCEALFADVISDSGFIQSKLEVVLKDCNNQVVFKTSVGTSKDKDYKRSYHEALRDAFFDIEALQYRYSGKSQKGTTVVNKRATLEKTTSQNETEGDAVVEKVPEIHEKPVTKVVQALRISSLEKNITFTSEDGFYKAIKEDQVLTFKEGSKVIGVTTIDTEDSFPVTTSEFSGTAFFLEGRLIVQRKIKGIVELVEMIFTKE